MAYDVARSLIVARMATAYGSSSSLIRATAFVLCPQQVSTHLYIIIAIWCPWIHAAVQFKIYTNHSLAGQTFFSGTGRYRFQYKRPRAYTESDNALCLKKVWPARLYKSLVIIAIFGSCTRVITCFDYMGFCKIIIRKVFIVCMIETNCKI